jgi:hypothetical protein
MLPLVWVQAVAPGLVCGWLLLWRSLRPQPLRALRQAVG